jgi:hypothetical protein
LLSLLLSAIGSALWWCPTPAKRIVKTEAEFIKRSITQLEITTHDS